MKLNFGLVSVVLMSAGLVACTHADMKAGDRDVASASPVKHKVHVHAETCQAAYNTGIKSPDIKVVQASADVCQKAAEAGCTNYVEQNSDGPETGDGRYIASMCELRAAVGAYEAVAEQAQIQGSCKHDAEIARKSASTGDVDNAADNCESDKLLACTTFVKNESDHANSDNRKILAAACDLMAAHGSYMAVGQKASKKK